MQNKDELKKIKELNKIESLKKYDEWLIEYKQKIIEKENDLKSKNKSTFWLRLSQTRFIQWFIQKWNKFKFVSPKTAKLIYQIGFFFIFSNGVTIWQYLVMLFLPNLFGTKLAGLEFIWPQVELWTWGDGTKMVWGIFNEPVKTIDGVVQIGGGLGNFLAFEVAVFTAQCINFPLQRNITFKSDGNPFIQAMWYFIGWVLISIFVNALWGFIGPIFSHLITEQKAITDLLKTFVTGGLSMVVFFFIFKIIFPEKKEIKQK